MKKALIGATAGLAGMLISAPAPIALAHATGSAPDMVLADLIRGSAAARDDAGSQAAQARISEYLAKHEYDRALDAAIKLTQDFPRDPAGFNLQGAAYSGKKDFAKARSSAESALALQPDYVPALVNLGQLDLRANDLPGARKRFQAALAKDPNETLAMLGMSRLEAASKNDQESLAWLERAKAAKPDLPLPRVLLAARYANAKNFDKALVELREAQRRDPNNPEMLLLLGQVQRATGDHTGAVDTFKKLASVKPESSEAFSLLAAAQADVKDFSGAGASLQRSLALNPDSLEALTLSSMLETSAGRYDNALRIAEKVQTLAPREPAGFTLEGDVRTQQKDFAKATLAYEKALSLRQTGPLAVKLHSAQARAGNAAEADARLVRWIQDHPTDTAAPLYLAERYVKSGKDQQAVEQYVAVLAKDPKNLDALGDLANAYQRLNDPRALATAEEAYRLAPDSPDVAGTLGGILVQQGQVARGLEVLQKAWKKSPSNTTIRYYLAVAWAKSGDKANARKQLEDLLRTNAEFPQRDAARKLLAQL